MSNESLINFEYSLLAVLLNNNDLYDTVSPILKPMHFSTLIGQKVYESIASSLLGGGRCDPITVAAEILRKNPGSDISLDEVRRIARFDAYKSMISRYAHEILSAYQKNALLRAIHEARDIAEDDSMSMDDRVAAIMQLIDGARGDANEKKRARQNWRSDACISREAAAKC